MEVDTCQFGKAYSAIKAAHGTLGVPLQPWQRQDLLTSQEGMLAIMCCMPHASSALYGKSWRDNDVAEDGEGHDPSNACCNVQVAVFVMMVRGREMHPLFRAALWIGMTWRAYMLLTLNKLMHVKLHKDCFRCNTRTFD